MPENNILNEDQDEGLEAFKENYQRPKDNPCGLYLISPPEIDASFTDRLAKAFDGGPVSAFQLRLKGINEHAIARLAEPLQKLCEERDVAFIINDSVSLAKRLGADGVHLGQGDGDAAEARVILGPSAQIGVTCHNSRHLAMEAGEKGADYVAFGAFYPTTSKEVRHYAKPEILSWWATLFELPSVAIGGITTANAGVLVKAGADFIATCAGVWKAEEGETKAVENFNALFTATMRGDA
ncbi:MAG: thiamine phosphate synthase [Zymomonas mobilis subsp. pomaceae]|uniref:Thiamine-phosphate synthase n=1 Tax=Zymomonas mobilis subsp. pomaceae (strain ATCC 29192 / DSM 22645 / JCM 10191 / CCUG 17912 / NBRC 13757 / NCIMB 11200 / NRRL B-4491 / Barker I) TaxID=579138 RepID=F8ESI4_ZYMMT|nr:thiamine phosphate synthase [Zymomonas mobilis]AEI37759.1 thiamine-phosphate pyrophosphorylase [Zymomonas mobilis subsp. pomaceae ATCC 29192]MDX5949126.1 thiamine phosphate synthase [Zymomonas mobilis subsp. pomaceae]GEB88933.1 thiamine-phosphate synthase [Zymomonas mobilis subsp. pomaceae]